MFLNWENGIKQLPFSLGELDIVMIHQNMEAKLGRLDFTCRLWVEICVFTVLLVSGFSVFSAMRLGGWVALVFAISYSVWQLYGVRAEIKPSMFRPHFMVVALIGLCTISLIVAPHCFLDSFSYRIPQMLLWLQEGHPWSVPNVDMRINQMPHVWPFLSAIFFLPFGERGLAVPNLISFFILLALMRGSINANCPEERKRLWILLIFISAPVFVMQASTNDNVLTCVTLLAISVHFAITGKPGTLNTLYVAFAFALCCGIKPQYVTLAPFYMTWFFIGNPSPFRASKIGVLIAFLPALLLCSPAPSFGVNYFKNGSISAPYVADPAATEPDSRYEGVLKRTERPKTRGLDAVNSAFKLGRQMLALPVEPWADKLNAVVNKMAKESPVLESLGFSTKMFRPILIEEGASLSFFATIAMLTGMVIAWRKKVKGRTVVLLSLCAMMLAVLIATPGTLGRSFIGFFVIMLPFAFTGLASAPHGLLKAAGVLCWCMGVLTIVINPACPLWPVNSVAEHITHRGVKAKMLDYAHYSKRHFGAERISALIPAEEHVIGAQIADGEVSAGFWKPYDSGRIVKFYPRELDAKRLAEDGVNYLIVKDYGAKIDEKGLPYDVLERVNGELVATIEHTSYMQKGPEPWFLIRVGAGQREGVPGLRHSQQL